MRVFRFWAEACRFAVLGFRFWIEGLDFALEEIQRRIRLSFAGSKTVCGGTG